MRQTDQLPVIHGFNRSSEAGPDNFAPSIFLGACNLRCAYCMNAKLVLDWNSLPTYPLDKVKQFVIENGCEWINISGGEILIHNIDKLKNLFDEIHSWDCKIAISTNGIMVDKLKAILPHIDYVTMDLKTDKEKYNSVVHEPLRTERSALLSVVESLLMLRAHRETVNPDFDYEVRTTMYRPLVGHQEMHEMGSLLNEDEKWVLQPFRQAKCMIGKEAYSVEPYSDEEMADLLELAKVYTKSARIRHV